MASRPTRASIDILRARRCESQKVGWLSRSAALDAADLMMAHGHVEPGCHITPYRCELCDQWHVFNRRIVDVQD